MGGLYFDPYGLESLMRGLNTKFKDLVNCSETYNYSHNIVLNGVEVIHGSSGKHMASWKINYFPSSDEVVVFHDAYVFADFRRMGIGSLCHEFRLEFAKLSGASLVLCTVNNDNVAEIKILKKFGWSVVAAFDYSSMWQKRL